MWKNTVDPIRLQMTI